MQHSLYSLHRGAPLLIFWGNKIDNQVGIFHFQSKKKKMMMIMPIPWKDASLLLLLLLQLPTISQKQFYTTIPQVSPTTMDLLNSNWWYKTKTIFLAPRLHNPLGSAASLVNVTDCRCLIKISCKYFESILHSSQNLWKLPMGHEYSFSQFLSSKFLMICESLKNRSQVFFCQFLFSIIFLICEKNLIGSWILF